MTQLDQFHAMLDANHHDHETRLVLADWLEEYGNLEQQLLGPGYRALGLNQLRPILPSDGFDMPGFQNYSSGFPWNLLADPLDFGALPNDWFRVARRRSTDALDWPSWCVCKTRRQIEDVVAGAFSNLPSYRQRELLDWKGEVPWVSKLSRKRKPKTS